MEEAKPRFGQLEFTRANIRYCVFQNERLEAIRGHWKVQAAISEFNTAVNDWNLYCSKYRYYNSDQQFVQRQVTKRKATLDEEGRSILTNWIASKVSSSLPPPRGEPLIITPTEPPIVSPGEQSEQTDLASGNSIDQMLVDESLQAQEGQKQRFIATFGGTWSATPASCNRRNRKSGDLININSEKAESDFSLCSFLGMSKSSTSFLVTAHCSNSATEWDANVSLTRTGNKLTWSSERGTDIFTRCE